MADGTAGRSLARQRPGSGGHRAGQERRRRGAAAPRHGVPVYASDAGSGEAVRRAGPRRSRRAGRRGAARRARPRADRASGGSGRRARAFRPTRRRSGRARGRASPVHAEIDLGLPGAARARRYIAITGTNGKTTTTALTAHLLAAAGSGPRRPATSGAAVATSRCGRRPPDWLALELSSFQLHDTPHLKPAVGVLTNLAPDHLDRYASLEEYYADKALPLPQRGRRSRSGSATRTTRRSQDDGRGRCRAATCGSRCASRADGWYDRAGRPADARGDAAAARARSCRCSATTTWPTRSPRRSRRTATGCPLEAIADGLRTFQALPHRLEPVREVDGVLWINDSKATNVASTEVAVAALDRPFVLLLGGRHKGEPYTRLAASLARRCRAVVAYGEAGPIVVQDLGAGAQGRAGGQHFDDVLATRARLAQPGRRGAAVAGLLQLRHVQELRGAGRALPRGGGGDVTGAAGAPSRRDCGGKPGCSAW